MINIIIPVYNSRNTLPNTLNSLVAQTQPKFFVTIIDDCSEENIDDIISSYKERLKLSYIKLKENVGPGGARQAGLNIIMKSNFDYVMFLDSDDMLMPQAIEVLNREASLNKPDILISAFIQQNKYGIDRIVHSKDTTTWLHGKAYKVGFLKDNNIHFMPGLRLNEDGAFNTMAYGMTNNIYRTSTITVLWIDNKNSLTRKNKNFYLDCLPDYIAGQVYAFNFLVDEGRFKENKASFAGGITFIYNYIQELQYNKRKISSEIEEAIRKFLNMEEVKFALLEDKEFRKQLVDSLNNKNTKNDYYFETQTFLDFINQYGIEME